MGSPSPSLSVSLNDPSDQVAFAVVFGRFKGFHVFSIGGPPSMGSSFGLFSKPSRWSERLGGKSSSPDGTWAWGDTSAQVPILSFHRKGIPKSKVWPFICNASLVPLREIGKKTKKTVAVLPYERTSPKE